MSGLLSVLFCVGNYQLMREYYHVNKKQLLKYC